MKIGFANPSERDEVLEWVRSQEGHESWTFLNWSDVLVARDDDGKIRGVAELAAIQTLEFILAVDRKAIETFRTWTAINNHLDGLGIHPLVIASRDADLTKFARKLMKPAMVGFEFFRRG